MTKPELIKRRSKVWRRFETLIEASKGRHQKSLDGDEVVEYSDLLRDISHDLAKVRSHDWGDDLERYLNDLVVRGHNRFYRSPPGRMSAAFKFFAFGFPVLLRANAGYFWVATALLFVPGVVAAVALASDSSLAPRIIPAEMLDMFDEMYSEGVGSGEFVRDDAAMAGYYLWHNGSIAFRCFAAGILLGLGTAFVLVSNGVILGGIAGYIVANDHSERFFTFVVGHGSFELIAIAVAGAAGLVLGHALVRPGQLTVSESLRVRGAVAVRLAAGAGSMILVASFIEGFWSARELPSSVKYTAGAISWALAIAYLLFVGRVRSAA